MHLNLPFADENQFERLHAAVRLVLPILPAQTASSPVVQGEIGDHIDMRMHFYSEHCRACPELIGDVVPEAVFDSDTYDSVIYEPIRQQHA